MNLAELRFHYETIQVIFLLFTGLVSGGLVAYDLACRHQNAIRIRNPRDPPLPVLWTIWIVVSAIIGGLMGLAIFSTLSIYLLRFPLAILLFWICLFLFLTF